MALIHHVSQKRKLELDVESRKTDLDQDSIIEQLKSATPDQINTYIDNNVTDLNSAKDVLKKLARLCVYLLKRIDQ